MQMVSLSISNKNIVLMRPQNCCLRNEIKIQLNFPGSMALSRMTDDDDAVDRQKLGCLTAV